METRRGTDEVTAQAKRERRLSASNVVGPLCSSPTGGLSGSVLPAAPPNVPPTPSFSYGKPHKVVSDRIGRRSPVRNMSQVIVPHPPLGAQSAQADQLGPSMSLGSVCMQQSIVQSFSACSFNPQPVPMHERSGVDRLRRTSDASRFGSPAFSVVADSNHDASCLAALRREMEHLDAALLGAVNPGNIDQLIADMPRPTLETFCKTLHKIVFDAVNEGASPPISVQGDSAPPNASQLPSRASSFHGLQSRTVSMMSAASLGRANVRSTGQVLRSIDDETGRKMINQFVVLSELGRGSQAKVKLVFDTNLSELRAMKIIRRPSSFSETPKSRARDLNALSRIEREVKIWRKIRHRNLVRLYEVIDDPKAAKLYLVMEYITGGPLTKPRGTFCDHIEPNAFTDVARQLCAGVAYLHHHNVVHRDIKPDNVLVDTHGFVHLVDYGVSEMFDEVQMEDSAGVAFVKGMQGTPAYMSPELLATQNHQPTFLAASPSTTTSLDLSSSAKEGTPQLGSTPVAVHIDGFASDVWSLGVTLFCCLVGRLPFVVARDDTLPPEERYAFATHMYYAAVLEGEPQFPPHPILAQRRAETKQYFDFEEPESPLAPEWESLIRKMLRKDPTERPSIREVHRMVKTIKCPRFGSGRRIMSYRAAASMRQPGSPDGGEAGITLCDPDAGEEEAVPVVRSEVSSYQASPGVSMTSRPAATVKELSAEGPLAPRRPTNAYEEDGVPLEKGQGAAPMMVEFEVLPAPASGDGEDDNSRTLPRQHSETHGP